MQQVRKNILKRVYALILIGCACFSYADAQPKSLGTTYSFGGISLSYEHTLSSDSFAEVSLKAEMTEVFMGQRDIPGISASFTWNMNISNWKSANGCDIGLYAGPGLLLGWSPDYGKQNGGIIGLKGRFGAECAFGRNVTISLYISPVIGTHAVFLEDSINMTYFKYGLAYALMPEIGIKYRFGK